MTPFSVLIAACLACLFLLTMTDLRDLVSLVSRGYINSRRYATVVLIAFSLVCGFNVFFSPMHIAAGSWVGAVGALVLLVILMFLLLGKTKFVEIPMRKSDFTEAFEILLQERRLVRNDKPWGLSVRLLRDDLQNVRQSASIPKQFLMTKLLNITLSSMLFGVILGSWSQLRIAPP